MTHREQYLALENARHEFETEVFDLLAIARAAGDNFDTAIDFATDDLVVGKLWDRLQAARNAA